MCCVKYAKASSLHLYPVDLDACIGAHHSAGGATDTRILVGRISEMIASVVHLLGLEGKHVAGTCHDAKVASFASLSLNGYGTLDFCHVSQ